jgi:hypothetical protein
VPAPPRRPISGATVALPSGRPLQRLRALPDHRLLDTLLRSRAWIWLLGLGLGGIVFMQVSLLKMNAGIGRAVETASTLERANAQLEGQVAELSSGDRIRTAAKGLGLISPDAGAVGYLRVRPGGIDGRRAARNMTVPSDQARQALATDGRSNQAATTIAAAPPATGTTTTTVAATTTPAAQATPAPTATPAPVASATPAPTAAPPAAGATGAATAPAGQG